MLPALTCTKLFADIPFAHRQHNHKGHCHFIHGHNWGFQFTFCARSLDENGFILDFGGSVMKDLKAYLNSRFDHKLVLNEGDPMLKHLVTALQGGIAGELAQITILPDASCEGLAAHLLKTYDNFIYAGTLGRVNVVEVTVFEDSKNSATAKL